MNFCEYWINPLNTFILIDDDVVFLNEIERNFEENLAHKMIK
jgi:ActR/RegA family two-component response regulator